VDSGIAICGSGVVACLSAKKIHGVRACLVHDGFSAHQGVDDDDINVIWLGGRAVANTFAWELLKALLEARFSGAARPPAPCG
jgi:ribose 5-phosphate isomerase B